MNDLNKLPEPMRPAPAFAPINEIRVILNQCGAWLELHRQHKAQNAVLIGELSLYRYAPGARGTTIGAAVGIAARAWFAEKSATSPEPLTLSPFIWHYNASDNKYSTAGAL